MGVFERYLTLWVALCIVAGVVFVWSNLVEGEPHFTLSQVALNDSIMVIAFAPIVALLLGLSSISVSWNTLLLSIVLYIVEPVIIAHLWRRALLAQGGQDALQKTLTRLGQLSLSALLLTLVILFSLRGEQIIRQPLVIGRLAVPILIQVYFISGPAYLLNRALGVEWRVAGPPALIGAQLLRAGCRDGNRAVRLPVGRGPGDGRRVLVETPGHALRRPYRPPLAWMV